MASSRFRLAAFSLVLSDLMFTLAPILFPTELRATASGFAADIAKIGTTLGYCPFLSYKARSGFYQSSE
jgi:hypothetical protein